VPSSLSPLPAHFVRAPHQSSSKEGKGTSMPLGEKAFNKDFSFFIDEVVVSIESPTHKKIKA
jgi:hypothetical protein